RGARAADRLLAFRARPPAPRSWARLLGIELEPVTLERERDERLHVAIQAGRAVRRFKVGNDLGDRARAVAAAHDRAGRAVELHHALGIEQHVRLLRLLPLEAEAAADARARVVGRSAHVVTP